MKLCTVSHFCLCRFTIHVLQKRHEKRTHLDAFPFPIRKVQADGGTEFAKHFTKGSEHDETRSWKQLREYGIASTRRYAPARHGTTARWNARTERTTRRLMRATSSIPLRISKGSWLGAIESTMHSRCVHWAGIHQTDV